MRVHNHSRGGRVPPSIGIALAAVLGFGVPVAAQTAARGGSPGHDLLPGAVLSGDYDDLPDQFLNPGPEFGHSVAADGDWLAVGAPGTVTRPDDPYIGGMVFVFQRAAGGWQLRQRLANVTELGNAPRCGHSVALRLPHLAIGCPGTGHPDNPDGEHGRMQLHRLDGEGVWHLLSNPFYAGAGSRCGTAVALGATNPADGSSTAVLGCPGWNAERGRVLTRTYDPDAGTWSNAIVTTADDAAPGDRFGTSVALYQSADPESLSPRHLAVGAPVRPQGAAELAGAVYVFESDGPGWSWKQAATIVETVPHSLFGSAIAINADQLLAGAPGGITGAACALLPRCGLVRRYSHDGLTWELADSGGAVNTGGNPPGPQVGMRFGTAVALGFDDWIAVAAPHSHGWTETDGLAEQVGMVELRRNDDGGWGVAETDHQGELRPEAIAAPAFSHGHFGTALAFGDRYLAVGYPHAGEPVTGRRGEVRVYGKDGIFADGFEQSP